MIGAPPRTEFRRSARRPKSRPAWATGLLASAAVILAAAPPPASAAPDHASPHADWERAALPAGSEASRAEPRAQPVTRQSLVTRCRVAARCSLAAAGLPARARGRTEAVRSTLEKALTEYRTALNTADRDGRLERFRRAAALFAQVAEPHDSPNPGPVAPVRNADLYANWGNAALGAEQLGIAVLAYRRALLLDPDNARARQNLSHARSLLPDWVPRPEENAVWETFFAWTGRLSLPQWQTAACATFLLAAVLLAAAIRWRRAGLRNSGLIVLAVWFGIVAWIGFSAHRRAVQDAVVVGREVIARSADSAYAPPRFSQPLPPGTEVQVIESRPDWFRVRLYDGRQAWLPAGAVQTVAR